MIKEVLDAYVETSFDAAPQAAEKLAHFEFNYRRFFPQDLSVPVLDIGIGRGEMLSCMKRWGHWNYAGVDISASTVEHCRRLELNCLLARDVAEYLAGRAGAFGCVTLLDVLEHVEKDKIVPLLAATRAALRPDGRLIVQVPNLGAPDGHLHRYNDITHEVGFVEHSLRQVLLAARFTSIECYGFEELIAGGPKASVRRALRRICWRVVRNVRHQTGNLNPKILHPVFFAVAQR